MPEPTPSDKSRSLLQLAVSLRLAAQRLAESANRMQQAASHQHQYLDRLNLLRDRIVELLGICRTLGQKSASPPLTLPSSPSAGAPAPASGAASAPSPGRPAPSRTRLPASAFVEFSNWQEFEKFRNMPPISDDEMASFDIEDLVRRLGGAEGTA